MVRNTGVTVSRKASKMKMTWAMGKILRKNMEDKVDQHIHIWYSWRKESKNEMETEI